MASECRVQTAATLVKFRAAKSLHELPRRAFYMLKSLGHQQRRAEGPDHETLHRSDPDGLVRLVAGLTARSEV